MCGVPTHKQYSLHMFLGVGGRGGGRSVIMYGIPAHNQYPLHMFSGVGGRGGGVYVAA